MLAALEKSDADALALMRHGHELLPRYPARDVRKQQVDEATSTQPHAALALDIAVARQTYHATRPS